MQVRLSWIFSPFLMSPDYWYPHFNQATTSNDYRLEATCHTARFIKWRRFGTWRRQLCPNGFWWNFRRRVDWKYGWTYYCLQKRKWQARAWLLLFALAAYFLLYGVFMAYIRLIYGWPMADPTLNFVWIFSSFRFFIASPLPPKHRAAAKRFQVVLPFLPLLPFLPFHFYLRLLSHFAFQDRPIGISLPKRQIPTLNKTLMEARMKNPALVLGVNPAIQAVMGPIYQSGSLRCAI